MNALGVSHQHDVRDSSASLVAPLTNLCVRCIPHRRLAGIGRNVFIPQKIDQVAR